MTLPQSGTISLLNLGLEFNNADPLSITEFYGLGNGPASGTVSLSDYYNSASASRKTSGLIFELDARNSSSWSGSGTTWNDISGNSRNFTLVNGPVNVNSAGTNSIDFDGTNDYAQHADATWIREGTQAFTAEAFVNIDSWMYGSYNQNSRYIFSKSSVSNEAFALGFRLTSSTQLYMVAHTQSSGNVDAGTHRYDMGDPANWDDMYHHFVWTYDGGNLKFYINGNLEATFTGRTFGSNSAPMRLMALDPNNGNWGLWVNGEAKVIRYYDTALTASEVAQNRSNCTAGVAPSASTVEFFPKSHSGVQFTGEFRFNERVGKFDTSDVTVTNGTKGTFTEVSRDLYTLDITPTSANAVVNVSIPTTASYNAGSLGNNAINQNVPFSAFATSGLLFRLDAEDGSSLGPSWQNSVTTWEDISGNNRDFSLINGPEGGLALNINAAVDFSYAGSNTLQDTGNALNLGTGDFTVECYVYHTSIAQNDLQTIFQSTAQSNTNNFAFAVESDRIVAGIWAGTFSNSTKVEGTFPVGTIKTHRWYHYAACRSSGVLRLFINGNLIVTDNSHTENYNNTSQYGCRVGNNSHNGALAGGSKNIQGYMSNVRVTTSALYTAAFTPPSGTLTNIANTVLLCCKSATNPRTAEVLPGNSSGGTMDEFGMLSATSAVPANSVDFDGTNDYAQISNASWIRQGNDAFSAEAFVNIDSWTRGSHNANERLMFSKTSPSNQAFSLGFIEQSNGDLHMIAATQGGGNVDSATHFYNMGTASGWLGNFHHFIWTYDGSTLKYYIDGALEATFTGRNFHTNTAPLRLFALDPSNGNWGLWVDGKAQVMSMYDRALSASEVLSNYNHLT